MDMSSDDDAPPPARKAKRGGGGAQEEVEEEDMPDLFPLEGKYRDEADRARWVSVTHEVKEGRKKVLRS
jgi:hypothetical protein